MTAPDLDGRSADDIFDWHPIEDQAERGARVLQAENAEWWGGHAQWIIAERAELAQDIARARRAPAPEAEAGL